MDLATGLAILVGLFAIAIRELVAAWWKRRKRRAGATGYASAPVAKTGTPTRTAPAAISITLGRGGPQPGRPDARWISAGEPVEVGGLKIGRGLFYLGRSLPTLDGLQNENALVDPTLPLSRPPGNIAGHGVPYYPSYASLTPESRRAYLDWLASARDNPGAYIGYVFIYFYGLERRLFVDRIAAEHRIIVAEVERLLKVYRGSRPVLTYASRLLDAAAAMAQASPDKPSIDPSARPGEIPLTVRVAIGAMLQRNEPVMADWALAWHAGSPEYAFRTPAVRCFPEFVSLFRSRFAKQYPQGLSIRAPRRKLAARYNAASGTFSVNLHDDANALPDIVSLTAPLDAIDRIVNECTDALDAYSRLVGRDPSTRGTLPAELSLPKELLQQPQAGGVVASIRQRIEALVPKSSAMVKFAELTSLLQIEARPDGKNSKAETAALAAALANLGFAIEPDPRYGGPTPPREADVMLFRQHAAESLTAKPSPEFLATRAQLELSVLVATADGDLDGDEARALIEQIKALPGLTEHQRFRLFGYLGYLVRNPPNERVVKRFKEQSATDRKALAEAAIHAAAANGSLRVDEVRFLERTYKALGFAKEELYRDMHEVQAASSDEPPTVAAAKDAPGIPIPRALQPKPKEPGIGLDRDRIRKIEAETAAAKIILDKVFNENPEPEEAPEPSAAPAGPSNQLFSGLDERHAALLREISSQDAIEAVAFKALAQKHGLFAAGAIETINEWSFQQFDEPLLDDGEPIEIAHHLFRVADRPHQHEAAL